MADKKVNVLVYSGMLIQTRACYRSASHMSQVMAQRWSLSNTVSGLSADCCHQIMQ